MGEGRHLFSSVREQYLGHVDSREFCRCLVLCMNHDIETQFQRKQRETSVAEPREDIGAWERV